MNILKKALVNSGGFATLLTGCAISGTTIYLAVDGVYVKIERLRKMLANEKEKKIMISKSHQWVSSLHERIKAEFFKNGKEIPVLDSNLTWGGY